MIRCDDIGRIDGARVQTRDTFSFSAKTTFLSMPSVPATLMAGEPWKTVDVIKGFQWLNYAGGKFSTRQIAQPPKATFVTRLQPGRLPVRAARQLLDP
jgi:hypothetical protein